MAAKGLFIELGHPHPAAEQFFYTFELCQAKCAVDVTEAVVIPKAYVPQPIAFRAPALVAHAATKHRSRFVVGHNHPAFTGGHLFIRIKGENSNVPKRPDWATFILCSQRFTGVFNDAQVVFAGEVQDGVHVTREAEHVHWENGPHLESGKHIPERAGCRINDAALLNEPMNFARVEVESMRINIDKNR